MTVARDFRPRKGGPIAVLLERSRDPRATEELLIALNLPDRYHLTDSRAPLRARMLEPYDVLVIGATGPNMYSRSEIDAIVKFVRRGGGLLLAGSAGVYERYGGAGEMGVAAIARRFGIEFASPAEAAGKQSANWNMVRGYGDGDVRVHKPLAREGVRREDAWLDRWSPLAARRPATTLMSHRRTGEPAAVLSKFGRGKVIAVGSDVFMDECRYFARRLVELVAPPKPRRRAGAKLRYEIPAGAVTRRTGDITVKCPAHLAEHMDRAMRTVRKVLPRFVAMVASKKKRKMLVTLTGSSRSHGRADWRTGVCTISLGVGVPDEHLAFALGATAGSMLHSLKADVVQGCPLGRHAIDRFIGLMAMRWVGFSAEADRLGAAMEANSRRRFRGVDAGWMYSEQDERPGLWIWLELARRYGDDLLERFFAVLPDQYDYSVLPARVYSALDVAVHFLSRAVKDDLYPWFASIGATVHPLSLKKFKSKAFRAENCQYLRRRLADASVEASERADAMGALVNFERADNRPISTAVRMTKAKSPAVRLVGAARLAFATDSRAVEPLRAIARMRGDDSLAAVAALLLVQIGRDESADRLAKLTAKADVRFQLEAGYQLGRLGHRAAKRFSLDGVRRTHGPTVARMETRYPGSVNVWPLVNGHHAANIFADEHIAHFPHGARASVYFFYWVHAATKFRRRGLARAAMARNFESYRARRCSLAGLDTGTRNTAHSMYRSFGFVDVKVYEDLTCELPSAPQRPTRVKGIAVRPCRNGDETAMAKLFNDCYGDVWAVAPARPTELADNEAAFLAWKGRKLVGYVRARVIEDRSILHRLAVAGGDKRQDISNALIGRLHSALAKRGVKKATVNSGAQVWGELLQPMGYRTRRTGGVDMIGLLDLPQFLEEIAPLLEHRLTKAKRDDWSGVISILGDRHQAALRIDRGKVGVLSRPPRRADVTLAGSDDTITRFVVGLETPFAAYLQTDLRIAPIINNSTREVLEAIFPKVDLLSPIWW